MRAVSVAGWSICGSLQELRIVGEAVARAIARSEGTVALVASGMRSGYAWAGGGEGGTHDTAMRFGALGGTATRGQAQIHCPCFASSGIGQTVVEFSVDGGLCLKPSLAQACRCPERRRNSDASAGFASAQCSRITATVQPTAKTGMGT